MLKELIKAIYEIVKAIKGDNKEGEGSNDLSQKTYQDLFNLLFANCTSVTCGYLTEEEPNKLYLFKDFCSSSNE